MLTQLPHTPAELITWIWPQFAPYVTELTARPLTAETAAEWLADWSRLAEHLRDLQMRLYVATTANTADAEAQSRFQRYLDEIFPAANSADQVLKEKLLASGLEPAGFE